MNVSKSFLSHLMAIKSKIYVSDTLISTVFDESEPVETKIQKRNRANLTGGNGTAKRVNVFNV